MLRKARTQTREIANRYKPVESHHFLFHYYTYFDIFLKLDWTKTFF